MSRGTMNRWTRPTKITVIWLICTILFYCSFRMAILNSSPQNPSNISGTLISNAEQRSILYGKLEKDLAENGAKFLKQGETSQSLSLLDLFTLKDGTVTPVLKAANPAVRANVLHLNTEYSIPISEAVKKTFLPYFHRVPATEAEIEAEAGSIKSVAKTICPLHIKLDRVVLTSTGVLLGCWQVVSGTDPVTIRAKLRDALPRAPEKQMYNKAMLHTSFARVLGPPHELPEGTEENSGVQIFHDFVNRLNNQIRGLKATVSELWYVEEYDLLALALNGKMKIRKFQISCSKA